MTLKILLAFAIGIFVGGAWNGKRLTNNAHSTKPIDFGKRGKYKMVKLDDRESLDLLERINVV